MYCSAIDSIFQPPFFMILSTAVLAGDLLREPPTRKELHHEVVRRLNRPQIALPGGHRMAC